MAFTPIKKDRPRRLNPQEEHVTITQTKNSKTTLLQIALTAAILSRINVSKKGPLHHAEVYQDPEGLRLMLHVHANPGPDARKVSIDNSPNPRGIVRVELAKIHPRIIDAINARGANARTPFPHDITTSDQGLNNRIFIEVNPNVLASH